VARECLPWKRPSTLWRILYHHTEPQHAGAPRTYIHSWESPGPDGDGPRFQSSAEAIAAELDHAPAPEACPEIWGAIARAVSAEGGIAGRRMVIVATDRPVVKGAPDDLVAAVGASQAFLQALSIGRDPALEEFCRRVNGLFRLAEPGAAVQAYLQLCTGHEVCWQPVQPDAHVLRIRVHGPDFCSEMRLPLMASA
jgi:hypothetical protein